MTQFYGALAEWWPILSPVEEYAEEAAEIRDVILQHRPHARTLLELGCGGGHVAHYLRQHFECCLTDISPGMLAMSRQLNPECWHVEGDMRTLDLGRTFDVVLVHDAIDYMTTEADLDRMCDTAWRHLSPGGLVMLVPDAVTETFTAGTETGGGDGADGRAARLLEWTEEAAPGATQVAVHYSFLLRDRDGRVRAVYERHDCGLFPHATWSRVLTARGFSVEVALERTLDDRTPRFFFLGHKPDGPAQPPRRTGKVNPRCATWMGWEAPKASVVSISGTAIASASGIGHTAGSGAGMQLSRSLSRIALLIVLGMSSAGCQVVGDIFQAGMWVGVIMVVLVLGGIAFLASKFRSGPR